MNAVYANIALPVPLSQVFTYRIPDSLNGVITRGSVVVVPFGKKILTGVVISLSDAAPNVAIKAIRDIADIHLSENTIRLAEWISEYYLSPLGETLRLFLPAGIGNISKRVVAFAESVSKERIQEEAKRSPQRKRLLELLQTESPLTILQLRKKSGIKNLYSIISEFEKAGIVLVSEQQKKKIPFKKEWMFTVHSPSDEISFRSEKQAVLWKQIASFAGEQRAASILKLHSASLSTLKALAQKGILSLYQKEVERKSAPEIDEHTTKGLSIVLNEHQQQAFHEISQAISSGAHSTFLLHGITGSGKTQVYIEAIRYTLSLGKTAMVLVPEISLTPQTVKRFQLHFGEKVIWMHSRMSDAERSEAWRRIQQKQYAIAIGPRSALFAPLQNLGLIVVDEEHESSYKQFDAAPRYNARDVAVVRGAMEHSVVVLGSATPSIESYANTTNGKFQLLTLPERADNAVLPPVKIVNMIDERKKLFTLAKAEAKTIGKKAFENLSKSISGFLEEKIRDRLQKREGIILLQNRRGFAPFLECSDCGYIEQCDRCSVTMTYHATKKHLRCHYCGKVKPVPAACPSCKGFNLSMQGFGTQRVEQELNLLFPNAVILRMDMDSTTRKGSHEKLLKQFGEGKADILLGTQMVAKGLDFPRVTLVGVISADTQMMLPDFRSAERTFQLLTQVAGRAGRSILQGEVIVQTSQPAHYSLQHILYHDFIGFYNEELFHRRSAKYPPFYRIIVIEFKGRSEQNVESIAVLFGKYLSALLPSDSLLGPSQAVIAKVKNDFRWHLVIKADRTNDSTGAKAKKAVHAAMENISPQAVKRHVKISLDVDPAGIL